MENICTLNVSH